jgi:acyl-CoA reductase-like NAD-dependent aldehyde dehydrogenase
VPPGLPVLCNFVSGSAIDPTGGKASPVADPCTGVAYGHAPVSSLSDVAAGAARVLEGRAAGQYLGGYESPGRAMRMSRRLDFGAVWINTHLPFVSEMPHGGFGQSGHGKDLSMYGFEEYTRVKHVMSFLG